MCQFFCQPCVPSLDSRKLLTTELARESRLPCAIQIPQPSNTLLPGLALFRAHAAVAMILCTSGVAECIGHVLWEGDAMKALSRDGSSDIVMILAYLHLSE